MNAAAQIVQMLKSCVGEQSFARAMFHLLPRCKVVLREIHNRPLPMQQHLELLALRANAVVTEPTDSVGAGQSQVDAFTDPAAPTPGSTAETAAETEESELEEGELEEGELVRGENEPVSDGAFAASCSDGVSGFDQCTEVVASEVVERKPTMTPEQAAHVQSCRLLFCETCRAIKGNLPQVKPPQLQPAASKPTPSASKSRGTSRRGLRSKVSWFWCKFPGCDKSFSHPDAVKKHCRFDPTHRAWLDGLPTGPKNYCSWTTEQEPMADDAVSHAPGGREWDSEEEEKRASLLGMPLLSHLPALSLPALTPTDGEASEEAATGGGSSPPQVAPLAEPQVTEEANGWVGQADRWWNEAEAAMEADETVAATRSEGKAAVEAAGLAGEAPLPLSPLPLDLPTHKPSVTEASDQGATEVAYPHAELDPQLSVVLRAQNALRMPDGELVLDMRAVHLDVSVQDSGAQACDGVMLHVALVYEDLRPLSLLDQGIKGDMNFLCDTTTTTHRICLTTASVFHLHRRFRFKVSPLDDALALKQPNLTQFSEPFRAVKQTGWPLDTSMGPLHVFGTSAALPMPSDSGRLFKLHLRVDHSAQEAYIINQGESRMLWQSSARDAEEEEDDELAMRCEVVDDRASPLEARTSSMSRSTVAFSPETPTLADSPAKVGENEEHEGSNAAFDSNQSVLEMEGVEMMEGREDETIEEASPASIVPQSLFVTVSAHDAQLAELQRQLRRAGERASREQELRRSAEEELARRNEGEESDERLTECMLAFRQVVAMMQANAGSTANNTTWRWRLQRDEVVQSMLATFGSVVQRSHLWRRPVVSFVDRWGVVEAGIDDGGLTAEAYALFWQQVLKAEHGLFEQGCEAGGEYLPCANADPAKLESVGRVLLKSILDNHPTGAGLCSFLFEFLCDAHQRRCFERGPREAVRVLASFDPQLGEQWARLLDGGAPALEGLTRGDVDPFLAGDDVESEAPLTLDNVGATVLAGCRHKLLESRRASLGALRRGFMFKDIDLSLQMAALSSRHLLLLVRGRVALSAADLLDCFDWDDAAQTFPPPSRVLNFFHCLIRDELDEAGRRRLLRWCTARHCLSADGLSDKITLTGHPERPSDGSDGDSGGAEAQRLPEAHTCWNEIVLPDYGSFEMLHKKLMRAMDEMDANGGFAIA